MNKYGKMLDNYEIFFYDKRREGRRKTNKISNLKEEINHVIEHERVISGS